MLQYYEDKLTQRLNVLRKEDIARICTFLRRSDNLFRYIFAVINKLIAPPLPVNIVIF